MGGFSYLISTLGIVVLSISGSILYIGRTAIEELEALIPFGHLALKHPGIGFGLGLALVIAGLSAFDRRSSILRTSPWH